MYLSVAWANMPSAAVSGDIWSMILGLKNLLMQEVDIHESKWHNIFPEAAILQDTRRTNYHNVGWIQYVTAHHH